MSEREFRTWLDTNAGELLGEIGVRENQIVLDYGCGPGKCTVPAARIVGDGGKVYALDINATALQNVRKKAQKARLRNIQIIHSDGTPSTELPQAGVDVALLYDVMQKIDDWRPLFSELHRILRPHGLLSVFPMHVGKGKLLSRMDQCGLFGLTDEFRGHVFNFRKLEVAS